MYETNNIAILQQVADLLPGPFYWLDLNQYYLGVNKAGIIVTGTRSFEKDFDGKTPIDLYPRAMAEDIIAHHQEVIRRGSTLSFEESIREHLTQQHKIFYASIAPLRDHQDHIIGTCGISIDITDKKRLPELTKAKELAEVASRSKSEFIANMSHDIRTPITGMLGMVQDMLYTADQAKSSISDTNAQQSSMALKDMIDIVQRDSQLLMGATDELLQLCNEILEVTRIESGASDTHLESFDLNELLRHNIELLQPTAQHKKLQLFYELDQAVPRYLKGSRIYLDRILLNLIGNGLKFTEKGEVSIGVSLSQEENTDLVMGDTIALSIQVKDTGIGIPEDKFDEIFEHFSRLTPSYEGVYKGSGLGLYTVKRYVEAMQGTIDVSSDIGRGSRFTMVLPLAISDHADRARTSIRPPISTKPDTDTHLDQGSVLAQDATASILIVEDNPIAAMAEKLAFKPFNCHIDMAASGTEAVAMAEQNHYDLIFMDVGLPDFSGIEATQKIRALNDRTQSQVPIVALTGHADNADIHQDAIKAGMQEILIKPLQALALEAVLQTYVFQITPKQGSRS